VLRRTTGQTYDARRVGPAVVEAIIKGYLGCCEVGNDWVSGAVRAPRTSDWLQGKNGGNAHKRVTIPSRRRARQPRLASPRSVNMVPESLRISRRGSGLWRSSSGSGLSMFQCEGSADNENYRKEVAAVSAGARRWWRGGDAVPCRPAIWLSHRTESHPKRRVG